MALGPDIIRTSVLERLNVLEQEIDKKLLAAAKGIRPPQSLSVPVDNADTQLFRLLIPRYERAGWTKVEILTTSTYTQAYFGYQLDFSDSTSTTLEPEHVMGTRNIKVAN